MNQQPAAALQKPANKRLLLMFGALTQAQLNSVLEHTAIDADDKKAKIKTDWLNAAKYFNSLSSTEKGLADAIGIKPLPKEVEPAAQKIQEKQSFKKTFANHPITIAEIEIDKVVASQRTVNLDYAKLLESQIKDKSFDLLSFCVEPDRGGSALKSGRSGGNAYTFASEDPSLRLLGAYESPFEETFMSPHHTGGQPMRAVIILVGFGSSSINVFKVGKRIILNNGFHRLYALRAAGLTHAPVVIQEINRADLELPEVIAELPRDYLVSADRPGLLKDFFDGKLTCEITQQDFIKSLQVGWGANEGLVPR